MRNYNPCTIINNKGRASRGGGDFTSGPNNRSTGSRRVAGANILRVLEAFLNSPFHAEHDIHKFFFDMGKIPRFPFTTNGGKWGGFCAPDHKGCKNISGVAGAQVGCC